MWSTAFSGTMVSASTKQSTRPELAAAPALRAAAQVPAAQRTNRTPASSPKIPTMSAVPSSLASSATMTSNGVSGSQRSCRKTPAARATLARMASRVSPISASSFRAGITKERRVSLIGPASCSSCPCTSSEGGLEAPTGDHQSAAGQQRPLPPRPDLQPGGSHVPMKLRGGVEAPRIHGELRVPRYVAENLRKMECDECPEKFPDAMPRVTKAARVKRLHDDDRSPGDASRF